MYTVVVEQGDTIFSSVSYETREEAELALHINSRNIRTNRGVKSYIRSYPPSDLSLSKHINDREPNFRDDKGNFYLVRCFSCDKNKGKENYAPSVASGTCSSCGWTEEKARVSSEEAEADNLAYFEELENSMMAI